MILRNSFLTFFVNGEKNSPFFFALLHVLYCCLSFFIMAYAVSWVVFISFFSFFSIIKSELGAFKKIALILLFNLLFNLIPNFWILQFDIVYGLMAVVINAFLFSLPYITLILLRNTSVILVCICWIVFELLTNFIPFLSPWQNLGYFLAEDIEFIQWYEYSGVLGGSVYILLINILLFKIIVLVKIERFRRALLFAACVFILVFFSFIISKSVGFKESNDYISVLVGNSNFDETSPIGEKYKVLTAIDSIAASLDSNVSVIVFPEAFINKSIEIEDLKNEVEISRLSKLFGQNEKMTIILGMITTSARKNETYNSALIIRKDVTSLKIKQKLVPITEYIPKPLTWINLASSNFTPVYFDSLTFKLDNGVNAGVLICYESIYPYFVNEAAINSNVLFIISSETSLKSSYSRQQYINRIVVRAIEGRRYIVKSSNNGSSCIIDFYGNINENSATNKSATNKKVSFVKSTIKLSSIQTFHQQYPFLIFYICITLLIVIFFLKIALKLSIF